MTIATVESLPQHLTRTKVPSWLYGMFFLSGISGLMYEVVWVRMLTRLLGSTVYATSTVLAAFMAGLALGSFLIGRYVDKAKYPLVWYAFLELGIGLTALLSLGLPDWLLPVYQGIYEMAGQSRPVLTAGQVGVALLLLLLPTALMGATLPTLSAFGARGQEAFGRYVGTLYALNTFGAVVGVVASGFVFIGELGETRTVLIGVALNLAVAVGAILWGWANSKRPAAPSAADDSLTNGTMASAKSSEQGQVSPYANSVRWAVVICFALNGLVILANEVIWSRMLVLYQGSSIYAFSGMLAVMLGGMAIGSWLSARYLERGPDPLRQFAHLQLALGVAVLAALLLYEHVRPDKPDLSGGVNLQVLIQAAGRIIGAPILLLGPLGLLSGLVFPVAARCYTPRRAVAGRSISDLYAWNTVGCIAGALLAGFALIPLLGVSRSGVLLSAISLLLGLALLAVHPRGLWQNMGLAKWGLVAACVVLLGLVGDPYYRLMRKDMDKTVSGQVELYRHVEEAAGTTTAFGKQGHRLQKHVWVSGQGMTALVPSTKLMAHLPIWLADDPHEVLVICFGMGTTFRSACRHDGLKVSAVELVGGVFDCFDYFHADGRALLQQPHRNWFVDDGRNFLLMRPQHKYDVITLDPAPPLYSAGTVNLYSREFFQLCKERLLPGGVLCMWIPPANRSEIKMILRTFLDVFEHTQVWGCNSLKANEEEDGLYLLGSLRPLRDVEAKVRKGFDNAAAVADLMEWGKEWDQPEKILAMRLGDRGKLQDFVKDAPLITDDHPYTEFPLWRALLQRTEYQQTLNAGRLRQYLEGTTGPNSGAMK